MRTLAVLTLVSLTLAGAGPVVSQTPTLDQALRRASAATPLPLTLARDQAEWRADHAELPADLDPAEDIRARIEDLTARAERDERLGALVFGEPPVLGRDCVATDLKGCGSAMGGYLALRDGRLLWQLQEGFTEQDGLSAGIVFFGDAGGARSGSTAPIAWSFDGARFDAPVLLSGPEFGGAAYIAVPGIYVGSGGGNADVLFRWDVPDSRRLTQVDTWSWRDGLAERLPPGLGILQGIRFDWTTMTAFTPLWQDGDGHCCGTGGTAILSFEITGDRLVLGDVSVRDALIDTAATTPTEVFDYAGRWIGCAHWGGEEPYDAGRRAEIARAVTELRCAALESDSAALRRKYADRPGILALITRAEASGG